MSFWDLLPFCIAVFCGGLLIGAMVQRLCDGPRQRARPLSLDEHELAAWLYARTWYGLPWAQANDAERTRYLKLARELKARCEGCVR